MICSCALAGGDFSLKHLQLVMRISSVYVSVYHSVVPVTL